MNPRLEAVTGPLKGEVFSLARERVSIGSDPSNDLIVYDPSIAKITACSAQREGEVPWSSNLDSPRGTSSTGSPSRRGFCRMGMPFGLEM